VPVGASAQLPSLIIGHTHVSSPLLSTQSHDDWSFDVVPSSAASLDLTLHLTLMIILNSSN